MGLLPFWNATLVMKYSLLRLTQTTRKFQKACTVHPILAKIILLSFEQKLIMSIFLLKWKNSKTLVSLFTFFDVFGRPLCIELKWHEISTINNCWHSWCSGHDTHLRRARSGDRFPAGTSRFLRKSLSLSLCYENSCNTQLEVSWSGLLR